MKRTCCCNNTQFSPADIPVSCPTTGATRSGAPRFRGARSWSACRAFPRPRVPRPMPGASLLFRCFLPKAPSCRSTLKLCGQRTARRQARSICWPRNRKKPASPRCSTFLPTVLARSTALPGLFPWTARVPRDCRARPVSVQRLRRPRPVPARPVPRAPGIRRRGGGAPRRVWRRGGARDPRGGRVRHMHRGRRGVSPHPRCAHGPGRAYTCHDLALDPRAVPLRQEPR